MYMCVCVCGGGGVWVGREVIEMSVSLYLCKRSRLLREGVS